MAFAAALPLSGSTSKAKPRKLLARAKQGDRDRLGTLLELYRNYLRLLADAQLDRKLRARVSPSDLVQETMLEAHRDFGDFRGATEAEFLSWLRKILVHNLSRVIEMHVLAGKRDVRREVSLEKLNRSMENSTLQLCATMEGSEETPNQIAERREQAVMLADAITELPPHYREVLVLRNLKGLPFNQVAEQMERSVPATKMLWMRALKSLKQKFRQQD